MERFFLLGEWNTWEDWRLILTAKNIQAPEPKTNYINIDGRNGSLDYTEALTGDVTYGDRSVTASFWTDEGTHAQREQLLNEITAALHGRKVRIVEPDDPDHYFLGRVKIRDRNNSLVAASFSMEATCDPWRYSLTESNLTLEVDSEEPEVLEVVNNGTRPVSPQITVTGEVSIAFGDTVTELTEGVHRVPAIKLRNGISRFEISGTGSVTLTFTEGSL